MHTTDWLNSQGVFFSIHLVGFAGNYFWYEVASFISLLCGRVAQQRWAGGRIETFKFLPAINTVEEIRGFEWNWLEDN